LVLRDGNIEAFDTPLNMILDKKSYLYKLVNDHGKEFYEKMRYMAENKDAQME